MCHIGWKTYPFCLQPRPKVKKNASNLIAKQPTVKLRGYLPEREQQLLSFVYRLCHQRSPVFWSEIWIWHSQTHIHFDSDVWDRVRAVLREAGKFGRECGLRSPVISPRTRCQCPLQSRDIIIFRIPNQVPSLELDKANNPSWWWA